MVATLAFLEQPRLARGVTARRFARLGGEAIWVVRHVLALGVRDHVRHRGARAVTSHRQAALGGVGRLLLHRERIERGLLSVELRLSRRNLLVREARFTPVLVRAHRADRERVEERLRDAGADHVELWTVRDLVRLDHGDEFKVLAKDGSRNKLRLRGANAIGAAANEARHDAEGVGLL